MNAEIWDIIDQNGNKTGKTTVRGRFNLNPGEYHLVVHIWIISSDGKILIQKRSKQKKTYAWRMGCYRRRRYFG